MEKSDKLSLDQYANNLMLALQKRISVEDLAETAAGNLRATRRVRLSKDDPEGREEPEHATRQRALEWIGDKLLPSAGSRKPAEAPAPTSDQQPVPGMLKGKRQKAPRASE